jgi:Flp pilus assembly protein TadG
MATTSNTQLRHRLPGDGAERGSVSLQGVILYPVFILLIFGILQTAFWMHAQNIAQSAASAGYAGAKAFNSSSDAGQSGAYNVLAGTTDTLRNQNVQVARSATSVTVTVTGTGPSIVPGWGGPAVKATVSGPLERWVDAP